MLLIRHLNKTVILLLFYVFPFFGVKTLASSAPQIKIMTLNTWLIGTPFYNPSKDDQIRMNGMFEQVAKLSPDIVALQEVWKPEYRRQVVERFERMGYQTLDPSKIVKKGYALDYLGGSGLFVFSKHPATLRDFLPFSQYTQPVEGLIKKGAMWVDIDFPEYGTIQFVNTHTGAVSFDLERNDFSK